MGGREKGIEVKRVKMEGDGDGLRQVGIEKEKEEGGRKRGREKWRKVAREGRRKGGRQLHSHRIHCTDGRV